MNGRYTADECWCEYVDIGVGEMRVAETPGCPTHMPYQSEDGAE